MIESILSLVGGLKGLILSIFGILGGLIALFYKSEYQRERARKEEAQAANRIYQAKEQVHAQDQETDEEWQGKVYEIRDRIEKAPTQEEAANETGDALDNYFGVDKTK